MKKRVFLLLIFAALLTGLEPMVETGYAAGPPAQPKVTSQHGKSLKKRKTHKRSKSRKKISTRKRILTQRSLSVLREYLPEYADVHETRTIDNRILYLPVPVTFDPRSPFIDPVMRYDLVRNIDNWLGTRYRFGGCSARGVDCSGFTSAVMSATLHQVFQGSSRAQSQRFQPIFDSDSLQFGDMLFFSGRNKRAQRIGHVGIYLGNGVFAHSSSGKGVIYTHISEGYYHERFRWGGRFIETRLASTHSEGREITP